ncbi:tyrosine-type recombinase/integrase [Roseibium sp.]|uniref:tyrosine-type recombinase/integrase n=1 Tax=Roseibium sp. TaxID=1936156 RepID=UPI003515706F
MLHQAGLGMSLYTRVGARKYLNADERERFLASAQSEAPLTRSFCLVLAYTGCRISEALALCPRDIQLRSNVISIRTLKKRGNFQVREVPVPEGLSAILDQTHDISDCAPSGDFPLWPWGRTTAWSQVKNVMKAAEIVGPHASPKGLRHGFGIHAVQSGVPLNLVQRWLGHAAMSTTAIYADAVGPEERAIAQRMW